MSPAILLFLAAVALSAATALVASARDDRAGFALFKPLTTFVVLLGAAGLLRPADPRYRALVVLGLALSLAGDVLLLPPRDRFLAALAAFLLAHLAYLTAFSIGNPVEASQLPWLAPPLAAGALVVGAAWHGLGRKKIPVLVYAAVVGAMVWRAAARLQASRPAPTSAACGVAGAVAFLASDGVLALRRFRRPFRGAHEVELGLYWLAQTLIALSVRA